MVTQSEQHAHEVNGTKEQILLNARSLFATHGYDGTSIRQLTSSLNITPAALYYHFASKNDVLEAVAQKLYEGSRTLLEKIEKYDTNPQMLKQTLSDYYDVLAEDIEVFVLVYNDAAIQHSPVGKKLRQQAKMFFAHLVGDNPSVEDRMRAAGSVGIIRLSLQQVGADFAIHRSKIVERAFTVMTD
jgi:AcrR family transcriptional regulator